MKRRDFLKTTSTGAVIPAVIGGFSLKAFGEDSPLNTLMANAKKTDHV